MYITKDFTYRRDREYRTEVCDIISFNKENVDECVIPSTFRNLTVSRIGDGAFEGKNLKKITIPETIYSIGARAFANNALTEIIIPNGVQIGNGAFEKNELNNVIFNEYVNTIGLRAFADNKLTSITLPEFRSRYSFLVYLAFDAFDGNNLRENIIIPNSVQSIKFPAFNGIIEGNGRSITLVHDGGRMFNVNVTNPNINIPASAYGIPVTKIAAGFFAGTKPQSGLGYIYALEGSNRKRINTLTLPANLIEIEPGAFAFCDISYVVTPNQRVKDLWDQYYLAQRVADRTDQQRAFNMSTQELRQLADSF